MAKTRAAKSKSVKKGGRRVKDAFTAKPFTRTLLDLPTELMVEIFCVLPYLQIAGLRQLCRRFKDIVDNTPILQYISERSAAGYSPEVPPGVSVVGALETFRRIQRAYRHPKIQTGPVQEWSCGALSADEWDAAEPIRMGDVVLLDHLTRTAIGVLDLRSNVPDSKRFRHIQFDFTFENYFVSISQGLVIFPYNRNLHFRSLKTGGVPQRLSAKGHGDGTPIPGGAIAEDETVKAISMWQTWMLVSVKSLDGFYSRILFHWPTGSLIERWTSRHCWGGCLVDGFALIPELLGEDLFPEWTRPRPTLVEGNITFSAFTRIYSEPSNPPGVMVYRLPANPESGAYGSLSRLATYKFPENLLTRRRSQTRPVARTVDAAWPGDPRACDTTVPLLELTLGAEPYSSFVPVPTFLEESSWTPLPDSESSSEKVFSWEEWSHSVTRVDGLDIVRACGSCGYHIVLEDCILDFNRLDNAHEIYKQRRVHEVRGSTLEQTSDSERIAKNTRSRAKSSADQSVKMAYRNSPFQPPKAASGDDNTMFFIEEADGPKLVELMYTDSMELYGMRYHSF